MPPAVESGPDGGVDDLLVDSDSDTEAGLSEGPQWVELNSGGDGKPGASGKSSRSGIEVP